MGWFSLKNIVGLAVGGPLFAQAQIQRDAQREQTRALQAMRDEDARKAVEAETGAAVAANAQIADAKRRRRSSALGLADPNDTLGGTDGALAAGGAPRAVSATYTGTSPAAYGGFSALGAGAARGGMAGGGGGGGSSGRRSAY